MTQPNGGTENVPKEKSCFILFQMVVKLFLILKILLSKRKMEGGYNFCKKYFKTLKCVKLPLTFCQIKDFFS